MWPASRLPGSPLMQVSEPEGADGQADLEGHGEGARGVGVGLAGDDRHPAPAPVLDLAAGDVPVDACALLRAVEGPPVARGRRLGALGRRLGAVAGVEDLHELAGDAVADGGRAQRERPHALAGAGRHVDRGLGESRLVVIFFAPPKTPAKRASVVPELPNCDGDDLELGVARDLPGARPRSSWRRGSSSSRPSRQRRARPADLRRSSSGSRCRSRRPASAPGRRRVRRRRPPSGGCGC